MYNACLACQTSGPLISTSCRHDFVYIFCAICDFSYMVIVFFIFHFYLFLLALVVLYGPLHWSFHKTIHIQTASGAEIPLTSKAKKLKKKKKTTTPESKILLFGLVTNQSRSKKRTLNGITILVLMREREKHNFGTIY